MKILIVIDDYFSTTNGMAISTQRFVKQFRQLGHEVRVLSTGKVDYQVPRFTPPFFNQLIAEQGYVFGRPVHSILKRAITWADIIHLDTPFFLGIEAGIVANTLGKPVTGTFHLYPENMTASVPPLDRPLVNKKIMQFFRNWSYKHCCAIQCPTTKVKDRLERYHFPQKLVVISNGIPATFLTNKHIENSNKLFTILCIGRYSREKDQATLLKAMRLVPNRASIQLILAGKGPLQDEYHKLAEGLANKPIMKYYPPIKLRQLDSRADLVVHCANVEVEGMACMEAFASGCVPVIANSPLSSTAAYALTANNQFPAGDETVLANRINYWYTHPNELKEWREKYVNYAKKLSVQLSAKKVITMMENAQNKE
ncbi:glycosyltransferase [Limosilactobacillus sp. STM2_1]|uniref:Glycosyltransferase n=1 Tax=Limosilactobacillus rudii TaxID=2759755 RepID=A0A7W3UKL4_9LACO|nr:glycosyltransferase [Limosilactobacillus rudii]MBB1079220.1 glycosyltransferase [Limosilactobacillus rudii]MBB1097309.1 glycosyltransferase [Limosilactobacillus rudii]MCD7134418.1 glycosyltransferase [Limosilactobacillus rudii]